MDEEVSDKVTNFWSSLKWIACGYLSCNSATMQKL